jgi:hypothetical protein
MIVFEATPQYEPAYRQSWFFSGGNCMRAQNMVRLPMDQKSLSTASPRRKNDPFPGTRSGAAPLNQSRHENHQRSHPRRKKPNPHSLK